jgi:hypothetical protein
MDLNNVLSGKLPIDLKSFPDLILVVPTRKDMWTLQGYIHSFQEGLEKQYRESGYTYKDLDAESKLLETYPDYYEIMDEAEDKKNKLLLSIAPEDTPDERFLKTPEEVANMTEKEQIEYGKYFSEQYKELLTQFSNDPIIRKANTYKEAKLKFYANTIETNIKELTRLYLLILMAQRKSGERYFTDAQKGVDDVLALPYSEYSLLMDSWKGTLEGFGLPF